ncbi:hypothetical protein V7S43_008821 [Phytophthora oleae]|uniref:non-specific serine/threonine protein kinase n=1 Tax=Phytophthora oleae TaxID=2107226 RepID=A0ABD3FGX8_9STRA
MDKYVKVRKIGQGSFGCAYLATRKADPNKQQFVIKEIQLDPRDQADAQREARLLAALDHPNIIACKESFMLKPPALSALLGRHRPSVLCIVTEFADGGDLSNEIERRTRRRDYFDPDELLGLFVQVCLALKHLHDRKILHRDIKPANIFLTKSGVVKLGDLGVATVLSHTLACAQTSIGTPYYTAPEICLGKRYNAKADIWSLGCVLFEMASFLHVFDGRSQRQLFDNIVRGATPQLPACGGLSSIKKELQALVDDMLRKEPRARPSVNQLIRRPIVLARIQSFLSNRALAAELNHTVLHGENVFHKKVAVEGKVLLLDVRHAEPVARPAVKPQMKRVGSLLGASRKARGLPSGALRRSRPLPKRAQPARVPGEKAAKRVQPKGKRLDANAAAQMKAKLKAQIKAKEAAAKEAAAVAALPDPPKAHGGVSERVAAFNAQWVAQKEQLVKNLPPPAPILNRMNVSIKPKPSARAYPKPVVVGKGPPPAPVGIRRQPAKQKSVLSAPKTRSPAVRDSKISLRERRLEFQRGKKGEKPHTKASPLDDPIILVQQLPDFKMPPPAPITRLEPRTSTRNETNSTQEEDNDLTSLPSMANLEFERMVLQLKSVVDSDVASDDENEDDEEAFDPNSPPPPYSPTSTSLRLETLTISVLEDPTFRSALSKHLQQHTANEQDEGQLAVDPAHQATLTWMQSYISSLL